jgi:hypothetical protein
MKLNEMNSNVIDCLEGMVNNPWSGTILEGYYTLSPASKGSKGENIVSEILKSLNYKVEPRENKGHDRIINDIKTEIKFALAVERNNDFKCIFNHIGMEKDWNEIILCCVNGDMEVKMVSFTKENFPIELCARQQGGKAGSNDDFMCCYGHKLLEHENAKILF